MELFSQPASLHWSQDMFSSSSFFCSDSEAREEAAVSGGLMWTVPDSAQLEKPRTPQDLEHSQGRESESREGHSGNSVVEIMMLDIYYCIIV